jgi:CRP-like cAMP-binding protein
MLDPRLLRTSRELFLSAVAGGLMRLPVWVVDRLTTLFEEEEVEAGRRIFAAGEPVELIYFMREGRVQLSREGVPPWVFEGRWVLGPGDAVLDRPYPRTAVALTNISLLRIPAEAWLELLEDSFDLARGAIAGTVRGVAELEARLWATQADPRGRTIAVPHHTQRIKESAGRPLSFVDRLSFFARAGMFRTAGVQVLTDVVGLVEERTFEAGAPLFTRENSPVAVLIVIEGEVLGDRRSAPFPALRVHFGPGTVVGGVAALDEPIRAWDAHAVTPVRVLALKHEDWFDLIEDHFDLVRSVLGQISLTRESLLEQLAAGKPELVLG